MVWTWSMRPDLQAISDRFYLAFVLWREARGETRACKLAVAYSILNRVDHPKWWGGSISTVITKPWQYSSMTDPKDPQLVKYPVDGGDWEDCLDVADLVIRRVGPNTMKGADSYYDTSIKAPAWATQDKFIGQLGKIRFFNTDGDHPENVKLGIDLTKGAA
jgi:N-acetylmuramoyl-L-alanine amidase